MKIAIGCDHAGFILKNTLVATLQRHGAEIIDMGTYSDSRVDYPDYAAKVSQAVVQGDAARGVLICGSGIGMSIAANKFPGIRATLVNDLYSARYCREHNDSNVLCLAGRLIGIDLADAIISTWLTTTFEGGRHAERLSKIALFDGSAGRAQ